MNLTVATVPLFPFAYYDQVKIKSIIMGTGFVKYFWHFHRIHISFNKTRVWTLTAFQERWTGICFDILDLLKDEVGFTYQVVESDNWGDRKESGIWNGIIGEVAYNRADMAVQVITTSGERSEVRCCPSWRKVKFTDVMIHNKNLALGCQQNCGHHKCTVRIFSTHCSSYQLSYEEGAKWQPQFFGVPELFVLLVNFSRITFTENFSVT